MTATKTTEKSLDAGEVAAYRDSVAEFYGVDPEDVKTTVTYGATGSMTVDIPQGVSEEKMVDTITEAIAESLGVHPQNVEVKVNMSTGEVTFAVVSDNFNTVQKAKFDLGNDLIQEEIKSKIETEVPGSSVKDVSVAPETTATIEFSIDADNAKNDLTQAAWQTDNLLSDFEVEIESKNVHKSNKFFLSQLCHTCSNADADNDFSPDSGTIYYW